MGGIRFILNGHSAIGFGQVGSSRGSVCIGMGIISGSYYITGTYMYVAPGAGMSWNDNNDIYLGGAGGAAIVF